MKILSDGFLNQRSRSLWYATLASAFVYFNYINTEKDAIEFKSNGGMLIVNKRQYS